MVLFCAPPCKWNLSISNIRGFNLFNNEDFWVGFAQDGYLNPAPLISLIPPMTGTPSHENITWGRRLGMILQGSTSKSIWNCPGFSDIPRLCSGLLPQRLSASADEWGALSGRIGREGWPVCTSQSQGWASPGYVRYSCKWDKPQHPPVEIYIYIISYLKGVCLTSYCLEHGVENGWSTTKTYQHF